MIIGFSNRAVNQRERSVRKAYDLRRCKPLAGEHCHQEVRLREAYYIYSTSQNKSGEMRPLSLFVRTCCVLAGLWATARANDDYFADNIDDGGNQYYNNQNNNYNKNYNNNQYEQNQYN